MAEHKNLAAALAAFQAELPDIPDNKTATVFMKDNKGKYQYTYADLSAISKVALPLLGKHGLAVSFFPTAVDREFSPTEFALEYKLMHELGEEIVRYYPLPNAATESKIMGGNITFARRYVLCAMLGVAPGAEPEHPEDLAAQGQPEQPRRNQPPAQGRRASKPNPAAKAQPKSAEEPAQSTPGEGAPHDWEAQIAAVQTIQEGKGLWARSGQEGWRGPEVEAAITRRIGELKGLA